MAENNSSAPLKTALPTNVEAFEHFVSDCDGSGIQYDGPSYEQGFLSGKVVGMDAAQAVAAQAAPAAVAVTDAQIDAILDEPAGMIFYVSDQRHKQHLFARRVLALAIPALPATEDSSAGDLAAVQAEPVATNAQEVQWRNIKKVVNALADFCFGSADDPRWGRAHIAIRTSLTAKDGLDILSLGLESLYTAPQAQPADALDAALIGDCLPMQPVIVSPDTGVYRFKENRIVTKLLSHSELTGYSLNEIARDFNQGMYSADEQMQLAQLIGYSVDGYGTLSYVTDESYDRAAAMSERLAAHLPKGDTND